MTVENLLSDKGKVRFDFSINYLNSAGTGVDASAPINVQTGENSFVTIPTQVGERSNNTDALVITSGARYGFTKDLEVYGRASAISIDRRTQDSQGNNYQDTDSRFVDAWLGLNYRFRDDIDKPAWLGFAELQLAEEQPDSTTEHGKSLVAGFTTYQTYDPIVLSMTGSVQLNETRKRNNGHFKPGNSLTLSPSVGFAVNDKVTLTTGLNWRLQQEDKTNGSESSLRRTQTSLDLGLGYALGKNDTLNINARPLVSGEGDVQVKMNWIHRLEN